MTTATEQENKKPVTVWLDLDLIDRMKHEQRRTGMNQSTLIRTMLMERFPRPEDSAA